MSVRRSSRILMLLLCAAALLEGCSMGKLRRRQGTDMVLPDTPRETLIGAVSHRCPDSTAFLGGARARATCTRAIDTLPDPSPIPGQKTP